MLQLTKEQAAAFESLRKSVSLGKWEGEWALLNSLDQVELATALATNQYEILKTPADEFEEAFDAIREEAENKSPEAASYLDEVNGFWEQYKEKAGL
ncbi:hypothetical protein KY305_11140 [Bacillus sp. YC2]|uniref:hypothetical protein n=1 Tax=Bacillus sp. YC2 TaxID=2861287 RepID=UPI001CA7635D|nr:hypothetical protein [Bacillus sp. YC2]MBY8913294.1 hypothetical protein [Bacillus sp. YC2]